MNFFRFSATRQAIGKYSDAVETARLVDESKEPLVDALNNRAAAHLRLGNYGRALTDSREAAQLIPTNIKAHYRYVYILQLVPVPGTLALMFTLERNRHD